MMARQTTVEHSDERLTCSAGVCAQAPSVREKSTGARSIVTTLEYLGVDRLFGLPGGAVLPIFDALYDSTKLQYVLCRHEQGAGHAAEGYAVSTGRVGVALVTSGPGATNLATPFLDANLDSVPLVAITGQVAADAMGTDAFQEADIIGATLPLTKHSFLVQDAHEIPVRIAEAFYIASSGRPGPVLVDIPKSVQNQTCEFVWPPKFDLPGYRPQVNPENDSVHEAAQLIAHAKRPVFYVGGGVIRAQASEELRELIELTDAPVVTTLNARGAFPDSDPHCLGMPGMHGTVPAVISMQKADVLIALGARFDDRVTGDLKSFAPHAKVIHADIDPAEINKLRHAHVPVIGDLKVTAAALVHALHSIYERHERADLGAWWNFLNDLKVRYRPGYEEPSDGLMSPQYVIERLGVNDPEAIFVTGVGQHQMWAQQFIKLNYPRQLVTSCGAGTMGFGVPGAMGAKAGNPDKTVWCIDGDGSFQMTNQELVTCALNNIPIKVALINNSSLGMVRQWQSLFYNHRYSFTDLHDGAHTVGIPNFTMLAQAMGCAAIRVEKSSDIDRAIQEAMAINDRPVVVEFVVSPDAMVWPMVAAGTSNDTIEYALGERPDFSNVEE